MAEWQLQEAKQRFSELVRRTLDEGPQVVTRNGREVVVVVPIEEYRRTPAPKQEYKDFKDLLLNAPPWPDGLEFDQDRQPPRNIDFLFEE